MNYASFWQRFAAMWIDFFVLLPLLILHELAKGFSKTAAIALLIPVSAAFAAYSIYYHGRYGQTLGKRVMGVRVVQTTGERLGWRQAWLRSALDVFFAVLGVVGMLVAFSTIADADYYGVGWVKRNANLEAHQPAWLGWVHFATQVWIWSEVVVMLFNRERRALHDFIAGTVVVSEKRAAAPQPQPA